MTNQSAVLEKKDGELVPAPKDIGTLEQTLLKALGLDKVSPEQRDLALAIAKQYGLDPMLRHLILIDGRPYITRDGLLWVAHRSGALDGIEVTDPYITDVTMANGSTKKFWTCKATIYRKDMSHSFTYPGRYPVDGRNAIYGPEMAIKVAEVMGLRRAFNVAAPTAEEKWEVDLPETGQGTGRPQSLGEALDRRDAAPALAPGATTAPSSPAAPTAAPSAAPVAESAPEADDEEDSTTASSATQPADTNIGATEDAEFEPSGLTWAEFKTMVKEKHVLTGAVVSTAARLWPDRTIAAADLPTLTDEERYALFLMVIADHG